MSGRSLRRVVAAAAASLAACAGSGGAGAARADEGSAWGLRPENIGTFGRDIDNLYAVILWVTGFAFVLTQVLLVYFLVRYRSRGEGKKAVYTHGHHTLEVIWTIVPGVLLFVLALYQSGTWKEIKITQPMDVEGPIVQVMAQQFAWNIRYPGPDGRFGTKDDLTYEDANLHVPVDSKVILYLRSRDVIHSIFLPNLRLKQDVVPGLTIRQWFEAKKTTVQGRRERGKDDFNFEIACAELCGPNHSHMRGALIVHKAVDDGVDDMPGDTVYRAGLSFHAWLREHAKAHEGEEQHPKWQQSWPATENGMVDTWTKWTK